MTRGVVVESDMVGVGSVEMESCQNDVRDACVIVQEGKQRNVGSSVGT
jgi:hypothetical protein